MKLYHGSNVPVNVPDLKHSKPYKDFGRGFYFILANRSYDRKQPVHDYDIVYGPIADDGVTYQLRRYEGGVISLERLLTELRYPKGITFQYFFGTERALKCLKRI